ncbi:phosphoglycolate phosphatase [Pelistega europaea]|uniref:Phosphoglycolate phosphatase n=1 Tax=Pelistega europaea TaxID=106147 RepID=A0A7Y4LB54_9BURK|nr:phosphoglycolate phosphatase [Pelistega europaea]
MSTYQAVLFDLDGTLVDSVPDIGTATNAMLAEMGRETLPMEQLRTFVGKGSAVLIKRALAVNIDPPEPDTALFEQAEKLFKKHYHLHNGIQSQLYPNVIEGLRRLQAMGLKLAVVTNKPLEFTVPLLEKMGIADFFSVVVGGDTCERKKPQPDQLYYACEQLGVTVTNSLFVGDSQNDTQAANAAKMDVLVLPYGYNEGKAIQTLSFNAIVDDIAAVADWIEAH